MPNNTYARQSSNPARTNSLDSGLTGQTRTPAKQVCYRSATHAFGPCLGHSILSKPTLSTGIGSRLWGTLTQLVYATLGSNPTD